MATVALINSAVFMSAVFMSAAFMRRGSGKPQHAFIVSLEIERILLTLTS